MDLHRVKVGPKDPCQEVNKDLRNESSSRPQLRNRYLDATAAPLEAAVGTRLPRFEARQRFLQQRAPQRVGIHPNGASQQP